MVNYTKNIFLSKQIVDFDNSSFIFEYFVVKYNQQNMVINHEKTKGQVFIYGIFKIRKKI